MLPSALGTVRREKWSDSFLLQGCPLSMVTFLRSWYRGDFRGQESEAVCWIRLLLRSSRKGTEPFPLASQRKTSRLTSCIDGFSLTFSFASRLLFGNDRPRVRESLELVSQNYFGRYADDRSFSRSRIIALVCSCETRDSLTRRTAPISFMVSSSK
jgi:hypothetical protein